MNRYRSARGPLAICLTWLQAGRPNHHGKNFINPTLSGVNGKAHGAADVGFRQGLFKGRS
jgi:hypothetical protein